MSHNSRVSRKIFITSVAVALLAIVALGVWFWGSSAAFFSVEFHLAELSPRGAEGGYAMPASGASAPTGLTYSCASNGKRVTVQWSSSVYTGYAGPGQTKVALDLKNYLIESFGIPTAYAGGGGGNPDNCAGGGAYDPYCLSGGATHNHPVPATVTYNVYLNGNTVQSNYGSNSYAIAISPDTHYSWGVQACAGGSCSSIQNGSFTCPGLPELTLTADSYKVPYDTGTTLRWNSTNTNSCTASGAWSGSRSVSGTELTGNLRHPTTYLMQCIGNRGQTQPSSATIQIENGRNASITACKSVVHKNEEFCLDYDIGTTASPAYCIIQAGSVTIHGPLTQPSGHIAGEKITGETTFTLNCEEGGNTASTTVKVLPEFQET